MEILRRDDPSVTTFKIPNSQQQGRRVPFVRSRICQNLLVHRASLSPTHTWITTLFIVFFQSPNAYLNIHHRNKFFLRVTQTYASATYLFRAFTTLFFLTLVAPLLSRDRDGLESRTLMMFFTRPDQSHPFSLSQSVYSVLPPHSESRRHIKYIRKYIYIYMYMYVYPKIRTRLYRIYAHGSCRNRTRWSDSLLRLRK